MVGHELVTRHHDRYVTVIALSDGADSSGSHLTMRNFRA